MAWTPPRWPSSWPRPDLVARGQARAQLSGLFAAVSGGWRMGKALEIIEGAVPTPVALRTLFPRAMRAELGSRVAAERSSHGDLTSSEAGAGAVGAARRD